MKELLAKYFGVNWTTNIPGGLALLCGMSDYFELLPDAWHRSAMAFCGLMLSLGIIAAKSSNVTNAPKPVESVVVPSKMETISHP